MSEFGYQRASRQESPAISWASRILTMVVIGYFSMLVAYALAISVLYQADGVPPSQQLNRSEIVHAVVLEGLHSSLGEVVRGIPWPSGVAMARIQSRVPAISPLLFHLCLNGLLFCVLGFIAGRFELSSSALVVPLFLFFETFGFLKSEIYTLVPLNVIPIVLVVGVQIVASYGFALWGKWSSNH